MERKEVNNVKSINKTFFFFLKLKFRLIPVIMYNLYTLTYTVYVILNRQRDAVFDQYIVSFVCVSNCY